MRYALRNQLNLAQEWLAVDPARELRVISDLLDSRPRIAELAHRDLTAGCAHAGRGAEGMTGDQVVRALIVKQMTGFSYRELAFHLADSRTYQSFCRFGIGDPAPSRSTLAANIKALSPTTLEAIHREIVGLACDRHVERAEKVRIDSTVVESNIHHPNDSELLWDCVRVLTRLLRRAQHLLGPDALAFGDRTRRAKRRRKEINHARFMEKRIPPYRDLLAVTAETRDKAQAARELLAELETPRASKLAGKLDTFLAQSSKVLDQARRRVLGGETLAPSEKTVSIFEPHTDIVRKDSRDTLYGHKICLTAGASSLVLDCIVLEGNPPDSALATRMVERLTEIRGGAPRQVVFDGGFASKSNLDEIKGRGVRDVVFAKGRGLKVSEMAKSPWVYRKLRNFRAGIEGIISFLKRGFGLDRCTWRTLPSFNSYVWASIIASNLLVIARHLLA
jgi:IS5 family transposase